MVDLSIVMGQFTRPGNSSWQVYHQTFGFWRSFDGTTHPKIGFLPSSLGSLMDNRITFNKKIKCGNVGCPSRDVIHKLPAVN